MVWKKMKNLDDMDYLDYSRIEVDILEVEMDTWEEWCLPGFSSSHTEQGCVKNALRSMVPSWLLNVKVSHGTSLCEKCTFCFEDWINALPIGSRVYGIIAIIATIACIAIIAIIEIDKLQ